ncbi:MAG: ATP phosphoribosyltransferase regulatory subunit [Eggerthellaceae bacterium]|jgi:ATP phosphoribosyltransferase regulatory subunit|nr:ATP phosphoribosyltransferase regulatory subunit [Eggerthellaceae bacterium]MDR2715247.1 ATP phosphoribosyltransferase regulatory subunit [Coriobacteriaceae bacterium]
MNFVTPSGFRDVLPEEARFREEIANRVQRCFAQRGYTPLETPTLEVMDVLQAGGRIPAAPFKFFDSQGALLAMRPDVTMQIARMCATRLKGLPGPFKFRYTQRVFREAEAQAQAAARELTQFGIESIGEEGTVVDAEILELFIEALQECGLQEFKLAIGTVGVLGALLEASGAPAAWKAQVLAAYHASNFVELDRLVEDAESTGAKRGFALAIKALPRIRGGREAIDAVRALAEPLGCSDGLDAFEDTYQRLVDKGLSDKVLVDFSVMSSFDYYTGIVVEAYAAGLGTPLGSGGRYDSMLAAYGQERPAAGFAFYLESVMAACALQGPAREPGPQRPLRIAVPKGALYGEAVQALAQAGLDTRGLEDPGRQLIIKNPGVEYVIVRPTDAPAFVALGAADCGICGKDSLVEADSDVVELVDLGFGGCRFVVAEPKGATEAVNDHYRRLGSIRVATKYPNITAAYYAKAGMQVEIVELHGNIELAPLTGMAERVVDITATGSTLRENNLVIVDEVLPSTARFFANVSAFRMDARVKYLAQALQEKKGD